MKRPTAVAALLVTALALVVGARAAHAQLVPLPVPVATSTKSGGFEKGIGIELLGLGPAEAFTRFGGAGGISLTTAIQVDLGARWALRFPLSLDLAFRGGEVGYGAIAFSPGAVYRWRSFADQRWIPYVGGGIRLAAEGVRRDFVGLPLLVTNALHIGEHHHHFGGGSDDPDVDGQAGLSPELWAGYEFHPIRWFAVIFGATYAWIRIDNESIHLLRQTVALRATF